MTKLNSLFYQTVQLLATSNTGPLQFIFDAFYFIPFSFFNGK
jgi:predicted ATPase